MNMLKYYRERFTMFFDQSFSGGWKKQLTWLVGGIALSYAFLLIVYVVSAEIQNPTESASDILSQLIDPHDGGSLGKWYTILVHLISAIVFGGMMISVLSNILERRVENYQKGEIAYKLRNHVIIIGFDENVLSLVKTIREKYADVYILIMTSLDVSVVRLAISTNNKNTEKIVVIHGQMCSIDDLQKINIPDCIELYVVGDNGILAHDSANFECVSMISEIWQKRNVNKSNEENVSGKKLDCHVRFEHHTVYSVFQFSDLKASIYNSICLHPYNLEENWAKKVLVRGPVLKEYKALEGDNGINADSTKHVHLIIVGMSHMGTALGVEAAQISHYPNFKEDDNFTRTHITFIDKKCGEEMCQFQNRFESVFELMRWRYIDTNESKNQKDTPIYSLQEGWVNPLEDEDSLSHYKHLGPNFTDLQWEFINGSVESPQVRKYLKEATEDKNAITTIAICYPDNERAIETAFYLPDVVLRSAHQILVYQRDNDTLAKNVNNSDNKCSRFNNIYSFGVQSDSYCNDKIGDEEGKWINAFYAKEFGDAKDKKSWIEKDDNWADEKWDLTSVSDKWSSIHCANMVHTKLRSIGCSVIDDIEVIKDAMKANMQSLIYTEHNRWVTEQLLAGFRPLLKKEWAIYHEQAKKSPKNRLLRAHANICSNALLKQEEPDSHDKDKQVTLALLEIIEKMYKGNDLH